MNFLSKPSYAKASEGKGTFILKTLGCKVNQYESQAMREALLKKGLTESENEKADFFVINSCTVTHKADSETRNLIRRFHKVNPKGKIVVAGCYAEMPNDRNTLKNIPGVAHLVRNSEKAKIADVLISSLRASLNMAKASEAISNKKIASVAFGNLAMTVTGFKNRDRAFIKIQDGCNHRCSYCKVSLVRGPLKSRPAEEILNEARTLIGNGFKELVLTGVCLGAWKPPRPTRSPRFGDLVGLGGWLAGLAQELVRIEGKFRIRLSSIEPGYVTDELIRALKNEPKLCKHLHIPLQSGDDKILKLMNRPYTARKFAHLVRKIRKHIPDAAITTDVLLGFPGEGERCFRNTLKFIKRIRPSRMHVFSYSKREGTQAAKFKNNLDKKKVKERVSVLTELSKQFQADFAKRFTGKPQEVLIESHRDPATGFLTGYTDRYVRVLIDGPDSLKNQIKALHNFYTSITRL